MVDDQSGGANKTAAQDLVQNKHVFMVVNNSSFAFLTYKFLLDAGVPQVNGGYDGTYYGVKGNENIISALGNVVAANGVTYDGLPKLMKAMGATKVAALGLRHLGIVHRGGGEPPEVRGSRGRASKAVYTNTTVDFGSTDVGPQVLGIKNSGADAVYLPLVAGSNIAVVQGLAQNGVKMKSTVLATGYGQPLLDQPVSATFGPEVIMADRLRAGGAEDQGHQAVPGRPQEVRRLHRRARLRHVHRLHHLRHGDRGLGERGQPADPRPRSRPTCASSRPTTRRASACRPIDISLETYGQAAPTGCGWYVQIKNGKFVLFPRRGSRRRRRGSASSSRSDGVATTTTAAPAAQ